MARKLLLGSMGEPALLHGDLHPGNKKGKGPRSVPEAE